MKTFRIHNMKSFEDSGSIEIKPITIFVGKNSCGKSSLLRFPAVLGQTFLARTDSPLTFFGKFVDYGSFDSVEHKGKNVEKDLNEISFDVEYSVCTDDFLHNYMYRHIDKATYDKMKGYMGESFDARFEVTIDKPQKQIKAKSLKVYYNDRLLATFERKTDDDDIFVYTIYLNFTINGIEEICNSIDLEILELCYFVPVFDRDVALGIFEEKIEKEYSDSTEIEGKIELFKNQIAVASEVVRIIYESIISDAQCMSYIGPFREDPKRIYRDTEYEIRDVGSKGENLSTILLRESEKDNGLLETVSKWIKKNYGYTLEISSTISGYFNILLVDENGIKSNIMDVGYGISQVLPIVTQLIRSSFIKNRPFLEKHDEIVLIEQPELHLHPAAQANLAELIVSSIKAKEDQRILIETHSEHLIRKLQVLVAKKKNVTPEMIAIYSVERNDNGQAVVTKMELNDTGRFLTKWPSGFFDKSHELASELREASDSEV